MGNPTVPPLVEIWHDGGFLVSEANGHQSRDTITLTGGAVVLAGTVLGQLSTGDKWAPWKPAGSDGSQSPAGILFGTRDATIGDKAAVAITRNAEVNTAELVWPDGVTPEQIATATEQLQAFGILLR